MSKSPDAFRTISEVSEWLDTPAHVLRFWESRFSQVKPLKRAGGRRYYRPADMKLLGGIKKLLHDDGITIRGVQKILREQGVKYVASLSPPMMDEFDGPTKLRVVSENGAPVKKVPEPAEVKEETAIEAPAEAPVTEPDVAAAPEAEVAEEIVEEPVAAAEAQETEEPAEAEPPEPEEVAAAPAPETEPEPDPEPAPEPEPEAEAPAASTPKREETILAALRRMQEAEERPSKDTQDALAALQVKVQALRDRVRASQRS